MRALLAVALLLLGTALAPSPLRAQDVLTLPAPGARVIDRTGTLADAQRAALESKLAAFEAEAGPQIVLLMVPATAPEDIATFAQRVAQTWAIGRRDIGDGVLVVVAKDERRMRIEVAKALEGAIPDLAARQIIDNAMKPAFRAGDYAGGLNAAVDGLMARIRGEKLPAPAARPDAPVGQEGFEPGGLDPGLWGFMLFFVVPALGSILTRLFGRKGGSLLTASAAGGVAWWFSTSLLLAAGAALATLVLVGVFGVSSLARQLRRRGGGAADFGGWGGGGSSSWGGGSSGGGGFSSGGGGDFGGGGASGDW